MRWLGIVLVLCFLASCDDHKGEKVDSTSLTSLSALESTRLDFDTKDSKPIALLFYSATCQPCKILQDNLSHKSLENLTSSYAIYPIDLYAKSPITAPFNTPIDIKSLRKILHIYATPTMVFFDTAHSVVFTHIGVLGVNDLALLFTLLPTLPSTLQTQESKQQWIASHLTQSRASKGAL